MQRFRPNRKTPFIKKFDLLVLTLLGLPLLGSVVYLFFQPLMGIMIAGYLGIMIHFTNQKIGQKYYDFAFREGLRADTAAFKNARSYRDHILVGVCVIAMHASLALLVPFSPMMLLAGVFCAVAYLVKLNQLMKKDVSKSILHKDITNKDDIPAPYQLGIGVQAKWGEYFKSVAKPYTYLPLTSEGIWFQIGREAVKRDPNIYENTARSVLRRTFR